MTTFDDRDKAFENKFAHEEEITFKVNSLRIHMLGLWAAERLGKRGDEADAYARQLVENNMSGREHAELARKLAEDFHAADLPMTAKEIQIEMDRLLPLARQKLTGK